VVTSEPDRGPDEINDPASTGAAWLALDRARAEQGPQTLTSALAAVYQHYLPLAQTLAGDMGAGHHPDDAMRAAEVGLAQAVLGWRRSDGQGFELFASISIVAQLDHLGSDYS
jgi:DNA-directed RNA polymerase specialized sigma subunit